MARLFDNPMAVVILVLIIVVVFGWKKLPDAARSLGRSTRILKSELGDLTDSDASKETVQGQASQPKRADGTVPGEAPRAAAPDQSVPGEAPVAGQQPPQNQGGATGPSQGN
ncbi:twin-arginine translocase TatA/TatE family subunit [Demetria terragena]|uniref:twin-arginine translocase TatA/TatE family subunit n=1 Tax=Demetria terragena TaxID=63959 RepID=UPI00036CB96A|nr:twin-arginine translocase TatA/TatE family subunit [Demetria terragena]